MIKIAIVEDNDALRGSLCGLFNRTEGMRCVASLSNLLNVTTEIGSALPDIILMDIGLPNISGIEGVRTIKVHFPAVQILMFTVFDDDDNIFDAIRTGREPNCPFETGYRVTVACIMAVESYRLGRTVSWNAETEEIV